MTIETRIPISHSRAFIPDAPREPRKGIAPDLLLQQVLNTVPYLADWQWETNRVPESVALLKRWLRANQERTLTHDDFDHVQYYRLCIASHYTTVATFVPTDVDAHIRYKLWDPEIDDELLIEMAKFIVELKKWNAKPISTRWLLSPTGRLLEGHQGEWLSVATAAYASMRKRDPELSEELFQMIREEVEGEAETYREFRSLGDGIGMLKACTLIAHNLGDLKRVIDLWTLNSEDPLFRFHEDSLTTLPTAQWLTLASELYKVSMSVENHRHFVLRKPRALRKSPELLLPLGPFFDDWGKTVGAHPVLSLDDVAEISEALIDGFNRLAGPVGYARALSGIENNYPGGIRAILPALPKRIGKAWTTGPIRTLANVSQDRFEAQWRQLALKKG